MRLFSSRRESITADLRARATNDVVQDTVARACEALGVPWYGPTFDS